MADDYEAMASVLRAFNTAPPGDLYTTTFLCDRSGLSLDEFSHVVAVMKRRGWLTDGSFPGETFRLAGRGPDSAGRNAAQLLALDVVAWIKRNKRESFQLRELPDELRHDRVLLELAVREIVRANAVGPRSGGPLSDETELVVQPDLRVYEFGTGMSLTPVQVQQHIGDKIGGDKNVNTGSGAIITGDGNVLSINADAAESLLRLIETLRRRGGIDAKGLDLLGEAARPGTARREVVGIVAEAIEHEPRLLEMLKDWAVSVPGHLARAAIVEGIKLYLKTKGVLPS